MLVMGLIARKKLFAMFSSDRSDVNTVLNSWYKHFLKTVLILELVQVFLPNAHNAPRMSAVKNRERKSNL